MKVVEIFKSIDGEGKRTGRPAIFIRLAGCNLRCCYCDTTYSFDCSKAKEMGVEEIVDECNKLNCKLITLTGGEPLIHKDVDKLIQRLCIEGYEINVETNGSVDLKKFIEDRRKYNLNVFFTVDYKVLSSGMNDKMDSFAFEYLDYNKDIVKCVVGSKEDMDDALVYLDKIVERNRFKFLKFNIWFSPIFGKIEPKDIVEYVLESGRDDITVQVQLHKIIWDPDKRGV